MGFPLESELKQAIKWMVEGYNGAPASIKPAIFPFFFLVLISIVFFILGIIASIMNFSQIVIQVNFIWSITAFVLLCIPLLNILVSFLEKAEKKPRKKRKGKKEFKGVTIVAKSIETKEGEPASTGEAQEFEEIKKGLVERFRWKRR